MASKIIPVDWEWVQGAYGYVVIFSLIDSEHLSSINIDNYNFVVNVQRGESPKNTYQSPCTVIDTDSKKIEYLVKEDELTIGDEYYYIELVGLHNDPNPYDTYNDNRKIPAQEQIRVFVRRKKENN